MIDLTTERNTDGAAAGEADLIRRLIARDETAFRLLIRSHHGSMVALAKTFVGSRGIAEEVAQDTWLAVLDGLERFEQRSSLKSWIFSILVNKARTRGVREGRTVTFSDLEAGGGDGGPVVDPARFAAGGHWREPIRAWDPIDPERIVAGRQILSHVSTAIDALAPAQRAVVILRDIEGHDADETCRVLNISQANQRVLLHRARARLRDAIAAVVTP